MITVIKYTLLAIAVLLICFTVFCVIVIVTCSTDITVCGDCKHFRNCPHGQSNPNAKICRTFDETEEAV